MKILLWYGNVNPKEKRLPSGCKQYTLTKLIARHEEALMAQMSDDTKKTFEKLKENMRELSSLNECDAFVIGFQLGAKTMTEVIEGMGVADIDECVNIRDKFTTIVTPSL